MDDLFTKKIHWSRLLLLMSIALFPLSMCRPHVHSRIGSNEASAQGSLKAIATGQEQFKSACNIDADKDGVGEYGFLSELGGVKQGRLSEAVSASPYIPRILGTLNDQGYAQKAGYFFKLYLPAKESRGIRELAESLPPVNPEWIDLHEKSFLVIAWPQQKGKSGRRAFAINQQGQPFALENSPWSGIENPPPWISPGEIFENTLSDDNRRKEKGLPIWSPTG